MGKYKDLTGMKFHKLTVIEQAGKDKYKKILWRCVCDCGNHSCTEIGKRYNFCPYCGADMREVTT